MSHLLTYWLMQSTLRADLKACYCYCTRKGALGPFLPISIRCALLRRQTRMLMHNLSMASCMTTHLNVAKGTHRCLGGSWLSDWEKFYFHDEASKVHCWHARLHAYTCISLALFVNILCSSLDTERMHESHFLNNFCPKRLPIFAYIAPSFLTLHMRFVFSLCMRLQGQLS